MIHWHDEGSHEHKSMTRSQLAAHEAVYHAWPPQAVRFRRWDYDRGVWYFRTGVTHRPRSRESTLTVCGLDWLGNHTVSTAGPATCIKCKESK